MMDVQESSDFVLSEVHMGSDPEQRTASTCFWIRPPGALGDPALERALNAGDIEEYDEGSESDEQDDCQLSRGSNGDAGQLAEPSTTAVATDETGDLVVLRKRMRLKPSEEGPTSSCLLIHHSLSTSLPNVGLQIWRGALLLADYILHQEATTGCFQGVTALELGAGTGLTGIIMARSARRVYITDRGDNVLDTCLRNVVSNAMGSCHVAVKELDWFHFSPNLSERAHQKSRARLNGNAHDTACHVPSVGSTSDLHPDEPQPPLVNGGRNGQELQCSDAGNLDSPASFSTPNMSMESGKGNGRDRNGSAEGRAPGLETGAADREGIHTGRSWGSSGDYAWSAEELEGLGHVTVLLAADVIYDDALTDALFECVGRLMAWGEPKTLYLALEKRYNFSLDDRAVVPNGFRNFRAKFDDVSRSGSGDVSVSRNPPDGSPGPGRLQGRLIHFEGIPQYLHPYERGADLELWELFGEQGPAHAV